MKLSHDQVGIQVFAFWWQAYIVRVQDSALDRIKFIFQGSAECLKKPEPDRGADKAVDGARYRIRPNHHLAGDRVEVGKVFKIPIINLCCGHWSQQGSGLCGQGGPCARPRGRYSPGNGVIQPFVG